MRLKKWLRRTMIAAACLPVLAALAWIAFEALDTAFPPPLPEKIAVSTEVIDRDGALLRAYATPEGRWRLAVTLDQIDPQFVKMLVAYEDKRFFDHAGVDFIALARAFTQFVSNGRIVSGNAAEPDTLVASARAYLNAYNRLLIERGAAAQGAMAG